MYIIDVIIILLILLCGVWGLKKGFIKSIVSLVGIVLVFIISYLMKDPIAETLSLNLPFFRFAGKLRDATILNVIIYQLIAFFIVFSILMVVYFIVVKVSGLIERLLKITFILAIPSKIGGFIVGIFEGVVISLIAIILLSSPLLGIEAINDSGVKKLLFKVSPIVGTISNNTNKAIEEIYELKDKFDNSSDKEDFNLSCLDVLLEHNVIGVRYSEKLVYSGKLHVNEDKAKAIIDKYKK